MKASGLCAPPPISTPAHELLPDATSMTWNPVRSDCVNGGSQPSAPSTFTRWSGFSLYVVATSFLPSVENSTPATRWSTGIHRLT
jgi:hypothetical protein